MRAGDADPGSLLRRRRRDFALPDILYTMRRAMRTSTTQRKTYAIHTLHRTRELPQYQSQTRWRSYIAGPRENKSHRSPLNPYFESML